MKVNLATQLLSRSTVVMIRDAIADDDIVLSLQKKGMYNHVADLCEHWNGVVDICNGRDGPHMPGNAAQRQTILLGWKRSTQLHTTFLLMKLGFESSHCCWAMLPSFSSNV